MTNNGSFSAQHYAGNDIEGAILRAKNLLDRASKIEKPTEVQLLARDLLQDAWRLAVAVPHLVDVQLKNEEISAESLELITRKVLEHAIFLEYLLHRKDGEGVVSVFLERSRAAYNKSFQQPNVGGKLPNWPNYEQMAKSYPALYEAYRRYSYLAHPKTCIPYSFMERQSSVSPGQYFLQRKNIVVADLAMILHLATDSVWVISDMV